MRFLRCNKCGNVLIYLNNHGVIPKCCEESMEEIKPSISDGSIEKHVPIIDRKDNIVSIKVGSLLHPMEKEHYIMWIVLETDKSTYIRYFNHSEEPIVEFNINDREVVLNAYEYCNIHGLFKAY